MKALKGATLALGCAAWLLGCGSDDKGSSPSDGGAATQGMAGAAGKAASGTDACHDGCVDTLAADCSNGPADQTSCESTCRALASGSCGAEYSTFQTCAEGKPITCSAQGLPAVEACSDQQTAFVACLTQ